MIDSSGTEVYCSPDDVSQAMDLPDPSNGFGTMMFDDSSHPSYEQVERMIRANSEIIDRRLMRSWRENRVVNRIVSIDVYEKDENTWRRDFYLRGGNTIQLERDLRAFDAAKGDKIEFRTFMGQWRDMTDMPTSDSDSADFTPRFWTDSEAGRLKIRSNLFQPRYDALRLTYRWGSEACARGHQEALHADDHGPDTPDPAVLHQGRAGRGSRQHKAGHDKIVAGRGQPDMGLVPEGIVCRVDVRVLI